VAEKTADLNRGSGSRKPKAIGSAQCLHRGLSSPQCRRHQHNRAGCHQKAAVACAKWFVRSRPRTFSCLLQKPIPHIIRSVLNRKMGLHSRPEFDPDLARRP